MRSHQVVSRYKPIMPTTAQKTGYPQTAYKMGYVQYTRNTSCYASLESRAVSSTNAGEERRIKLIKVLHTPMQPAPKQSTSHNGFTAAYAMVYSLAQRRTADLCPPPLLS